jgi:hypothetical protein
MVDRASTNRLIEETPMPNAKKRLAAPKKIVKATKLAATDLTGFSPEEREELAYVTEYHRLFDPAIAGLRDIPLASREWHGVANLLASVSGRAAERIVGWEK